jgi:outer membrane protein assembly factor BamB
MTELHCRRWRARLLTTAGAVFMTGFTAGAQVSVPTQHNNQGRTGANLQETILRPTNVDAKHFGQLFKHVVDDQVYGQPLIVPGVEINGGTHDVVYITTVNNSVYAFDANDGSSPAFWHVNFGAPASLSDGKFGCTDMTGNMGIVGTPVIDPERKALYVVALTKTSSGFLQRLHALDLATGADLPASPVTIQAPDFNPLQQNQRPALALSRGTVYIGYASHCDKEPYHGYLLAYDAATLQQTAAFNTSPTGMEASIWQSGQAPAVDSSGNLYVVTGNGTWDGKQNFSESFLKLSPQLKLLDWFTPADHLEMDKHDYDLNSAGAMLIPGTDLLVGGSKSGMIYVLHRDHFGHLETEANHPVQSFQATSSHLHSMVYWKSAKNGGMLYLWGQRDQLRVYRLEGEHVDETPFAIRSERNQGHPGAMLSLSANGGKDGILWASIMASGDAWHESRPGILHAYDADDIHHELWNSLEDAARDDCDNYSKMTPPTVANGKVYLASFGTRNTGTGQFCVYGLLPDGPAPAKVSDVKVAASRDEVALSWAASEGAQIYCVKVAKGDSGTFDAIASGLTTPQFIDRNVSRGATYRYVVSAVSSNGESAPSDAITVVIPRGRTPAVMH